MGQWEGVKRVLAGGYSHIDNLAVINTRTARNFSDAQGRLPFHLSTTKYQVFGGEAWGFRHV